MFVKLSVTSLCNAMLSVTPVAVALVAMLSSSSIGNELDPALRLSGWFS
jgi:uncharacterized membrane protein YgaE (UPF0421/DUF939 family)